MIKTIRYIVVKKWEQWHIINVVVSGFMMYAILQFTCEMDIFFFPSTELRHYSAAMEQYNISDRYEYGFLPKNIPEEATNVDYFYTTEGYWGSRLNMHVYLKMTVSEKYLHNILEKYENNITYKLECSKVNEENAHEYLPRPHLDEYVDEYYGKENCILYFMGNESQGMIIDWNNRSIKMFLDNRFSG
jgi:hypothetical protein